MQLLFQGVPDCQLAGEVEQNYRKPQCGEAVSIVNSLDCRIIEVIP